MAPRQGRGGARLQGRGGQLEQAQEEREQEERRVQQEQALQVLGPLVHCAASSAVPLRGRQGQAPVQGLAQRGLERLRGPPALSVAAAAAASEAQQGEQPLEEVEQEGQQQRRRVAGPQGPPRQSCQGPSLSLHHAHELLTPLGAPVPLQRAPQLLPKAVQQ